MLGHISSGYGYRDHPINGNYQFHGGVDIGANMGDPIQAFASGTVEYTGEDDSYGLYFQIDHGNGVKSFYAHCSTVLVRKGQAVSIGDTVALVGSTGTATGPHLHLELSCVSLHVNPIYYIEYLQRPVRLGQIGGHRRLLLAGGLAELSGPTAPGPAGPAGLRCSMSWDTTPPSACWEEI